MEEDPCDHESHEVSRCTCHEDRLEVAEEGLGLETKTDCKNARHEQVDAAEEKTACGPIEAENTSSHADAKSDDEAHLRDGL